MIVAIVAIIAVAAIGLVLMVVWPACVVSGRISEAERQAAEQSQPNDNNDLSFGNGNEADNAL
jgi:hypothetical protein